jgi:hypothetical protein
MPIDSLETASLVYILGEKFFGCACMLVIAYTTCFSKQPKPRRPSFEFHFPMGVDFQGRAKENPRHYVVKYTAAGVLAVRSDLYFHYIFDTNT